MSLTKNLKPKTKKFFIIADTKTCRIFWGFEQLSNAIVGEDNLVEKHLQTSRF